MNSYSELMNVIESFNDIFILHHIHPDYDCLGAQFGLATWLKDRYPEKTILCGGHERGFASEYFPALDTIDEEFAKKALVILVDTAVLDRIDGKELFFAAKQHMYIDHHIKRTEPFPYEYVNEHASSTCEIITNMIQEIQQTPIIKEAANYLYAGIISDSVRFSINSTTSKTLKAASYLLESELDINAINRKVFEVDPDMYRYSNELRSTAHYEADGFVYVVVPYSLWTSYGLSLSDAKSRVSIFGEIQNIRIWAVICELEDGTYSASIRSHTTKLSDIANSYGGGGHACACGIPVIEKNQLDTFIQALQNRASQE